MKECNEDVCDDTIQTIELMFIVYSFRDARSQHLTVTDKKSEDEDISYLDHLPIGVYIANKAMTVFMWNRFYVLKHSEMHSSPGKTHIDAYFRQIEHYFRCQWYPVIKQGLFA